MYKNQIINENGQGSLSACNILVKHEDNQDRFSLSGSLILTETSEDISKVASFLHRHILKL